MRPQLLVVLVGFLVFGASVHATSLNLDFNTEPNSPGLLYDGNYAISPYMGTVNGSATIELYCDDFIDDVYFGQQNISVYATGLVNSGSSLLDDTRYGVVNPNSLYSSGAQLYDQLAWLTTQMQNTSGNSAAANDIAIQEAIWVMTNGTGAAPRNSASNTGTATSGDVGTAQSYLQWIADAQADYNKTSVSGYANVVASDWYIVTAVSSAGCTVGSDGSTGCTPGIAGTGNVTQEFLAYAPAGSPGATPEPASFFLIGSGLIGVFVCRRHACRDSH